MKLLSLLLVFTLIISITCLNHKLFGNSVFESVKSISTAITDVIQKFYIENKINFDFIIYGNSSKYINALSDQVIKNVSESTKISLFQVTDIKSWDHKLSKSAVIFVKTIQNLLNLQINTQQSKNKSENSKLQNINEENFKFLVYIEEMKNLEIFKNFSLEIKRPRHLETSDIKFFEYFITHDRNIVNLSAYLLFSDVKCYLFTPKLLNTFDMKSQKWNKSLENFDHFSNFYGCFLSFFVYRTYVWYHTQINEEEFQYNGLLYELLKITSEKLNFSIHYICFDRLKRTFVHDRKNARGHFIQPVGMQYGFVKNIFHSTWKPYGNVDFYYLVTKNELYTNYEKLFFPFDDATWIYLSITFGLTFMIIFILQRCPQWIKVIVFGAGVRSPGYNVISILFGFSQRQVPSENFSRIILFLFIWFCLMFRNCYQSMIFDFMTTDMRKPMPQSVDDLYKMNYKIICYDYQGHVDINKEIINGRESPHIIKVNLYELQKIYKDAVNEISNEKLAFLVDIELHTLFNFTNKKSLPMLNNEKTSKFAILVLPKNFILLKSMNFLIDRFFETGITNHFIDYGRWYLHRPFDLEFEDSRRILSIKDLEYGFVIWLFACFVSFLVFLCEIRKKVYQKIKKWVETFAGFCGFLIVLKTRMKRFH
ncbi:hypothetical protein PVAND_006198 [Polypedilum vanderplanki]|uniref:Ionotropic receptor n=1 Tax=Polypedilum vanderplanki TaxID=319348 RepID=A0A9J6C2E9_POLVA|nr:hypothetical protein PVAND_006198 [Polypedilum vanderplanki]